MRTQKNCMPRSFLHTTCTQHGWQETLPSLAIAVAHKRERPSVKLQSFQNLVSSVYTWSLLSLPTCFGRIPPRNRGRSRLRIASIRGNRISEGRYGLGVLGCKVGVRAWRNCLVRNLEHSPGFSVYLVLTWDSCCRECVHDTLGRGIGERRENMGHMECPHLGAERKKEKKKQYGELERVQPKEEDTLKVVRALFV